MRKWIWSVFMALVGAFIGIWWLKEREATTPTLTREDAPPRRFPNGKRTSSVHEQNGAPTQSKSVEDVPETDGEVVDGVSPDALTEINGVGPAFERALNAIGIFTYAQLASQTPENLAARMNARGVTAERIERDQWIEQAKERAG